MHRTGSPEQRGRLSNPVLRRLSDGEIQELTRSYSEGESIDALARRYDVHRTTVMSHLERSGVERHRLGRKMTDASVAEAVERYVDGASLAAVAPEFGVHARTLAREFRRAGVSVRARRGA